MHYSCYLKATSNHHKETQYPNETCEKCEFQELEPLYCLTQERGEEEKGGRRDGLSPELVTTSSSSSSNDQGLGDEIPDDSDSLDDVKELEAGLRLNISFYENVPNLDCSIKLTPAKSELYNVKLRQPSTAAVVGKPPIYTPIRKTKIPTLMSCSVSEPRSRIGPDGDRRTSSGSRFFALTRSYHENSTAESLTSRYPLIAKGSAEQLAERGFTPKEESETLLRRCKENWRRPISTTMQYPERSVIMPIRRYSAIPQILTPYPPAFNFTTEEDSVPKLEISRTIQRCLQTIEKASNSLKNIEEDVLLTPLDRDFKYTSLKKADKPKLEPNPDADKYKNCAGGRIVPVERRLAFFRNRRSTCICCRIVSSLHRLYHKPLLGPRYHGKVRISKRYVVIRDRCHCFANITADHDVKPSKISSEPPPLFIHQPFFAYIIWFAVIAHIIRVFLLIFNHE